jgi:hypothetical protein
MLAATEHDATVPEVFSMPAIVQFLERIEQLAS